jgi:hypothetical protein
VRKSFDEMVAAELDELLELLLPVAMGFAASAWLAADELVAIPASADILPPCAVVVLLSCCYLRIARNLRP